MNINYTQSFSGLFLTCFFLLVTTSDISAQLILERELIGAVATTSTNATNGNTQQLQVDASFGETMIGYKKGDIIITVGFQQALDHIDLGGAGHIVEEEEDDDDSAKVLVNAYPNPTVESLTIDLGSFLEEFTEIRLIDVSGRTVKLRSVVGDPLVNFTQLDRLPSAVYFLAGVDQKGKLHQLSKVIIGKNSN